MCGIAGLVRARPGLPDRRPVDRMVETLRHRGPDGEGHFAGEHVILGMRRLSIIDLAGGWQPLYNEDRSLALVANAEIYNFIELRSELLARGHRFATGSDCETILHLYEELGTDCVGSLRGMFAFALWDAPRRRLVLARDRLGEKPLYLRESEGELLFASELRALLRSGRVPFELDPDGVDRYFHFEWVPEPATPLRGVRKLPPATVLTLDVDPWRAAETCYWRMEDAPPLESDPARIIREELERISELVIRADVPVGVGLSGGLDSGAIAALAARRYQGRLHAFSIGYPGRPPDDERAEARELAEGLGLDYHEREVSTGEAVDLFPEVVHWRDEPIADVTGPAYYLLMRLAREHKVPVMLLGQGGDELFWGYSWVRRAAAETRRKDALLRRGAAAWPAYLRPRGVASWTPGGLARWALSLAGVVTGVRSLLRDRSSPPERTVFYDLSPHYPETAGWLGRLYAGDFAAAVSPGNAAGLFSAPRPWPNVGVMLTQMISRTYLLSNGIAQGDRLSMAASVELRLPLVDHRLCEIVVGLRKSGRTDQDLPPKTWLKAAIGDLVPREVMARPKRGFTPPVTEWIRALTARHGRDLLDGYLVANRVLSPEGARVLTETPRLDFLFLRALVLETWCRKCSSLAVPAGQEA